MSVCYCITFFDNALSGYDERGGKNNYAYNTFTEEYGFRSVRAYGGNRGGNPRQTLL